MRAYTITIKQGRSQQDYYVVARNFRAAYEKLAKSKVKGDITWVQSTRRLKDIPVVVK